MPHPGEDRLLPHQTGVRSARTFERRFERAVQSLDPIRDIDVAKVPATKILEPLGCILPCIDEGVQLDVRITDVWITGHIGFIVQAD